MLTVPSLRRWVRVSSTRNASLSASALGLGRPTSGAIRVDGGIDEQPGDRGGAEAAEDVVGQQAPGVEPDREQVFAGAHRLGRIERRGGLLRPARRDDRRAKRPVVGP
jgi:hypothetical protein